jgi:hypothetical protein
MPAAEGASTTINESAILVLAIFTFIDVKVPESTGASHLLVVDNENILGDAVPKLLPNVSALKTVLDVVAGANQIGEKTPSLPTGNGMKAVLAFRIVLAKGPLIKAVVLPPDTVADPEANVPVVIDVPSLRILVLLVVTMPDVNVSVPLTESGTFKTTPDGLLLFILKDTKLVVGAVAEFLKTPIPDTLCVFIEGACTPFAKLDKLNVVVEVKVPLFTIFPATLTVVNRASEFGFMIRFPFIPNSKAVVTNRLVPASVLSSKLPNESLFEPTKTFILNPFVAFALVSVETPLPNLVVCAVETLT